MISPESYWFSQDELHHAATLCGADSVACFVSPRYTAMPRQSVTTSVLGGLYNVVEDATLYTLPCRRLSEWLWNPRQPEVGVPIVPIKEEEFHRDDPSKRLLHRLGCTNTNLCKKVVVGSWLVAIFVYSPGSQGPNDDKCHRAAFTLVRDLLRRYRSWHHGSRWGEFAEMRRQADQVVMTLAPQIENDSSKILFEYLDALGTRLSQFTWPTNRLDISASVHMLLDSNANSREPAKVLESLAALPLGSQVVADQIRGQSSSRHLKLSVCAEVGRISRGQISGTLLESVTWDHFEPGLNNNKKPRDPKSTEQRTCLVRHASCLGECYLFVNYKARSWSWTGSRKPSFGPGNELLGDLNHLIEDGDCATDLVFPLSNDDGDYCLGAVSVEGTTGGHYLDLMRLYLAQHIAHTATKQLMQMRAAHFRQSAASTRAKVLAGNVSNDILTSSLSEAKRLLASAIDCTARCSIYDLSEKSAVQKDGEDLQLDADRPVADLAVHCGNAKEIAALVRSGRAAAAKGSTPSTNPEDDAFLAILIPAGGHAPKLQYRLANRAFELHPLPPELTDWASQLVHRAHSLPTESPARERLIVPLWGKYESAVCEGGNTPYYCCGVLVVDCLRPLGEVLDVRDLSGTIGDFANLVALLQRSRSQSLAEIRMNDHDKKYEVEIAQTIMALRRSPESNPPDGPSVIDRIACSERLLAAIAFGRTAFNANARKFTLDWDSLSGAATLANVLMGSSGTAYPDITWMNKLRDASSDTGDDKDRAPSRKSDDKDRAPAALVLAMINLLRNAQRNDGNANWTLANGPTKRAVLRNEVKNDHVEGSKRHMAWFPHGLPGRGRSVALSVLKRYFSNVSVVESIEESEDNLTWSFELTLSSEGNSLAKE
jgi:hypothetical protein